MKSKRCSLALCPRDQQVGHRRAFRRLCPLCVAAHRAGWEAGAKVVIAPTPFELARLLEQRRVDYYMESVYPTYTINYVHGAGIRFCGAGRAARRSIKA